MLAAPPVNPNGHHIMGRCPFAPRHAAGAKCTPIVLVMFLILSYELDMARSSSALRRPPAAPSVPAGGFARRGPPGSAQVPPAAVDLGQPPDPRSPSMTAGAVAARNQMLPAAMALERVTFDDGWQRRPTAVPDHRHDRRAPDHHAQRFPTSRSPLDQSLSRLRALNASIATRAPLTPILACHPA